MSGELLVFITCYLVQKHLLLQSLICFFPGSPVGKESTCNAGDPSSIPGSGRSTGKRIGYPIQYSWASLVAQLVKNPPATWVQSLGWDDPLKKGNGNPLQYSGLENSMDCIGHGVAKSQTRLSDFHSLKYLAGGAVLSLESHQSGRNLMYLRKQKEAALIRAESQKELFTGRL